MFADRSTTRSKPTSSAGGLTARDRCGPGLLLLCLIFGAADDLRAAEEFLPTMGGPGGGQFIAPCPAGQNLHGFELRAGDDVDAIRPVCVTSTGANEISAPVLTTDSGLVPGAGSLGGVFPQVAPGWYGGPGGGIQRVLCPAATPLVFKMEVISDSRDPIVSSIHLYCGAAIARVPTNNPSAIFDTAGIAEFMNRESQSCPSSSVAVGVHGRSGIYLDALGLICDAARIVAASIPPAPAPPRVTITTAAPGGLGVPAGGTSLQALVEWQAVSGQVSSYTVQRSRFNSNLWETVRQTNSLQASIPLPASAEPSDDTHFLFRVCAANASGSTCSAPTSTPWKPGPLEAKRDHTVLLPAPAPAPVRPAARVLSAHSSGSPKPVCDAAKSARARNSPASAGLEDQCRAAGSPALTSSAETDAFEAKGKIIADGDPMLAALRDQQSTLPMRRGSLIAMAAAGGDTLWGPGKQRILDSLSPGEQEGFKVAVSFSMDRNRDPELAATGAAIAAADPVVLQARGADPDPRYWLGFDIASGIFGDPARGALGNTGTGPGSLGIRDALNDPARRGFNASVQLHLSRHY